MNNISGRLQKELQSQKIMDKKLKELPEIFRSYYNYLRAGQKTYSTLTVYINGIIRFAKHVCGDTITNNFYQSLKAEDVESFLITLETTTKSGQLSRMSGDARCTYWSYLNSFWEFLVKREYVNDNIVVKTTRPKNNSEHKITYLTKSEIKRLLKAIDSEKNKYVRARNKTIISIGLTIGLRCSAVANLNVEDIDFQNNLLKVTEKGDKTRFISFSDNLRDILQEWLIKHNKNMQSGPLFYSQKGDRISTDAINDALKKYINIAKIDKHITFHKLRHSLAINSLSAGIPLIAVSKALNHQNISTTNRYIDVTNEDKIKMTNLADSWIG